MGFSATGAPSLSVSIFSGGFKNINGTGYTTNIGVSAGNLSGTIFSSTKLTSPSQQITGSPLSDSYYSFKDIIDQVLNPSNYTTPGPTLVGDVVVNLASPANPNAILGLVQQLSLQIAVSNKP